MITIVFYWSTPAFWCSVAALVLFILMTTIRNSSAKDDSSLGFFTIILMIISLLVIFVAHFGVKDKAWRSEAVADITGGSFIEERTYHDVEFLGKKTAIFNFSDARWYVDMGNGSMVSYNRIMNEAMCRRCEQFKDGSMYDSIHVYRVQKDKPSIWSEGPVMFFSKHADIFLQATRENNLDEQ